MHADSSGCILEDEGVTGASSEPFHFGTVCNMVPKGPTSCKGVDCREANMVGGNLIWGEWEPSSVEPMYWWTYRDGGPFMILHKKQGVGSDNTTTWCGTNGVILIV